jgi:hypothetical protein
MCPCSRLITTPVSFPPPPQKRTKRQTRGENCYPSIK